MKCTFASALSSVKCTTGCPVLDRFLHGGLPCGVLIEIAGALAACADQLGRGTTGSMLLLVCQGIAALAEILE